MARKTRASAADVAFDGDALGLPSSEDAARGFVEDLAGAARRSAPEIRPRTADNVQPAADVGSRGRKDRARVAAQPAPISREILEDRYDGAIDRRTKPGNYSRLGQDLANAVAEVIARTARFEDDRDLAGTGGVEGVVLDQIREIVIREIDERGLAR